MEFKTKVWLGLSTAMIFAGTQALATEHKKDEKHEKPAVEKIEKAAPAKDAAKDDKAAPVDGEAAPDDAEHKDGKAAPAEGGEGGE